VPEWISLNGRLTPAAEASVSPLDRGFLYGDSVFETLRTYGGRPFRLTSHLDRLRSSAQRLAIPWPEPRLSIDTEIGRALEAARNTESAIRIMLTRGVGPIGYDPSGIAFPTLVVHVRPCPEPPPSAGHEGVDVAVVGAPCCDVLVFLGDGAGALHLGSRFLAGTHPASVAVGDLNGDKLPDLVVGGADGVSILLGR